MNSKRTNLISEILNIIILATLIISTIFGNVIADSLINTKDGEVTFFNDGIVNSIISIESVIPITMFILIFLFNIISAIQNKNDKKLTYWKIILSASSIITMIQMILNNNVGYSAGEWIAKIGFGIVPIILAIINLLLMKKNKPKVIQVISYVVVIIISVVVLLNSNILGYIGIAWCLISAIMQLIYTHIQMDEDESKTRKITNIIIYYIIQLLISVGFFAIMIYSLLVCKINGDKIKNEAIDIANKISEQMSNSGEEWIGVEKDSKYGFINEKGEEIIKAEYDIISPVNTYSINNKDCEYVFAQKDNNYYIILKNKNIIDLNSEIFKKIYENYIDDNYVEQKEGNLKLAGMTYLEKSEKLYNVKNNSNNFKKENDIVPDNIEYDDDYNTIYTYVLKNEIKMIVTEIEKDDEQYEYNVVTKKNNQVIQSDKKIFIPMDYVGNIKTYSNGNIPFYDIGKETQGWYDVTTGQTMTLKGKYQILDITTNNYLLIRDYSTSEKNEMLVNGEDGNIVMQGKYIDKTSYGFIVTEKNGKMYFVDERNTNQTSKFDVVIDISQNNNKIFVVANKNNNSFECKLMDLNGKILTRQTYSKIGNNINWSSMLTGEVERNSEYYFDEIYESNY